MTIRRKNLFLIVGPLLFIVMQLLPVPKGMTHGGYAVLCSTIWIAIWWVTEAVPIAVTALLPIILFPLTGAVDLSTTTASYGHKYVFLYLGGFMIAIAIEKWNLHKRIALHIINAIGTNIYNIILGFMTATGFLSMWISNTATAVMMLPIGMSIVVQLKDNPETDENENLIFGKALMLSIAYSASIGGMATLIGTPPNLVFAGYVQKLYGIDISFWQWIKFGLPISVILMVLSWLYLTRIAFHFEQKEFPGGKKEIRRLINGLGPIKREEKIVLGVFVLTAFCWITRSFLLQKLLPGIDDTIIAMVFAVLLFIIPANKTQERIITWHDTIKIPWGIILLFGGGMAMATAFEVTGLATWLGNQMTLFEGLSVFFLVLVTVTLVNFMTELTSNLATTAMLMPILAPIAVNLHINPLILMVSATLAASCAFMLPVATPPNAVVFGSGYLRIPDMTRAGFWMNILSIVVVTLMVYLLLPLIWNLKM